MSFRTTLLAPGSHVLAVRLVGGDDALPGDDESEAPVAVTTALPVLLVDGKPGLEPYSGATDFLRAALAPAGDDTPQVRATVVTPAQLDAAALRGQSVVVLANVDRLAPAETAALGRFLDAGGGVLIAPGDRADAAFYNGLGWMPAKLGVLKGDPAARQPVAHPAPATFSGPVLSPFAEGDAPPLAEADCFAYHVLAPGSRRLGHGPARHGRPLGRRAAPGARPGAAPGRGARRRGGDTPGQPRLRPPDPRVGLPPCRRPGRHGRRLAPNNSTIASASRISPRSSRPRPPGSPRAGPWPSKPTRRGSKRASSPPNAAAAASSGAGSCSPPWPASASKST